jgi:mono/diheme cytochrome c family protein
MPRQTIFVMTIAAVVLALNGACTSLPNGAASNAVEADIAASRTAGPVSSAPGAPIADRSRDLRAAARPSSNAAAEPVPTSPPGAGGAATGAFADGAAQRGDPERGRRFALGNCRPCHVVAADQSSPIRFANAPAFDAIANSAETTPAGLNVWLTNPHPTMPSLRLTPAESVDVIAYIMSLRTRR